MTDPRDSRIAELETKLKFEIDYGAAIEDRRQLEADFMRKLQTKIAVFEAALYGRSRRIQGGI